VAAFPDEVLQAVDDGGAPRQHAAGVSLKKQGAGHRRTEGHRQGRHQGALCELRRMGIKTVMITGDNQTDRRRDCRGGWRR
jgi:cation transport ATPase